MWKLFASLINLKWKFAVFAGIVLAVFALYPQARLMFYLRGQQWQGNFAITDTDEMAYAAYLQSLIDGKARKNNPHTKHEDTTETPQDESLFSVQFFVPYLIAVPARILGISAPTAMTIAGVLAAFLLGLALFWLIESITHSPHFALAGALVVVCFGAFASGSGGILYALGAPLGLLFPSLRRYVPAIPLPLFFLFCGLVWHYLAPRSDNRTRIIYGIPASLCFWLMVFSYLYIWTSALALLVCIALLFMIARPEGWFGDLKAILFLGAACSLSLIPYGILLSHRSDTLDSVQALVLTHAPDFTRIPEYIGVFVLILLAWGVKSEKIPFERPVIFVAALALLPLAVHNQQVITGREIQPYHYSSFIVNYVVLAALVLSSGIILLRGFSLKARYRKLIFIGICLIAIGWGIIECHIAARFYDSINVERDRVFAVAKRLNGIKGGYGTVVCYNEWAGDDLAMSNPQPVLWAWHQIGFGDISWQESKKRYYQYLYFKDYDRDLLVNELKENEIFPVIALFGPDRYLQSLTSDFKLLTDGEIMEEANRFADYTKNFRPENSPGTVLSYAIVPNKSKKPFNMTNIDKWYDRDAGDVFEGYTLYRLKLKESR
jgi:hypothetical protein